VLMLLLLSMQQLVKREITKSLASPVLLSKI